MFSKKLIIVGIASSIAFAGAGIGGWALVDHYKENVKNQSQQLVEAIERKIIPFVDEKFNQFSAEWMSKYSTEKDFDFTIVEGYNKNLEYKIDKKEVVNQELKITVRVSNSLESANYDVTLTNQFATPEVSSQSVIKQTIESLPKYVESVDVSSLPEVDSTVAPETIVFNSPDFKKDAIGNFIYKINGSILSVTKTIDSYSNENQILEFISEYKTLSGTSLTEVEIRQYVDSHIRNGDTLILFEITDGMIENNSATIMIKDFSSLHYWNSIENAEELSLALNNPYLVPTAREIIESINNNNPEKYLNFVGLPANSNFKYSIKEASTIKDDVKEETVQFTVVISQDKNTRTYITTLSGLLSFQQNELNNIVSNDEYNWWAIKPRISSAYINETISTIINSPDFEAFEFISFELQRYPEYDYVISNPTKILLGSKPAISVYVEMVSKENPDAKMGYYVNITTGFKP